MKTFFITIVVIYLTLCAALFTFQKSLLFFPQPAMGIKNGEPIEVATENISLSGWKINAGKEKAIIYYGGNAEVIERNADQFEKLFVDHTVYFFPYRGYGNNGGEPSEEALYKDAVNIYDQVSTFHSEIALIGRSLGTGVATYVASQKEVSSVILITPYDSITAVAGSHYPIFPTSLLVTQKFDSLSRAAQIKVPTLIVIAEQDKIVPPHHAHKLSKALNAEFVQTVTIEGATHNSVANNSSFETSLTKFLSKQMQQYNRQ